MKIRRNITVDKEVWELAKIKISEPLSCFIQKQLEIACNLTDDKYALERELYDIEQRSIAIRSQLTKINQEEMLRQKSEHNLDKCIPTINRIYNVHEVIGENQICNIARANDIECDDLIRFCRVKGYNVVPLFEFDKETSKFNGSGLR